MLSIEPIRAFSDNYIWLLTNAANGQCFVVDPGDAEPVLEVLAQRKLTLAGILVTHHHFDHVGGVPLLRERTAATVYGPHNPAIEGIDHRLAEGDTLSVLGFEFSVLEVPGHTLDHIAYFCAGGDDQPPVLFCGDTLFAGGCGRMFEGTAPVLYRSLAKLAALPGNTRVYCAHEYTQANLRFAAAVEPGNHALADRVHEVSLLRAADKPTVPSRLTQERATNPFLRCAEPAVVATLQRLGKWRGETPEEVFAALRTWKDSF
ncbi:MAG TPA: hydroxyacylglutathione hydrolase [Kineobactrum sp.]